MKGDQSAMTGYRFVAVPTSIRGAKGEIHLVDDTRTLIDNGLGRHWEGLLSAVLEG